MLPAPKHLLTLSQTFDFAPEPRNLPLALLAHASVAVDVKRVEHVQTLLELEGLLRTLGLQGLDDRGPLHVRDELAGARAQPEGDEGAVLGHGGHVVTVIDGSGDKLPVDVNRPVFVVAVSAVCARTENLERTKA